MHRSGTAWIEVVRALGVLALLFLNFAHTPVAAATPAHDILTAAVDLSFCGEAPATGKPHAPCHACRIGGGADLPNPPVALLPPARLADVAYGAMPVLLLPVTAASPYGARAPPIA